MVAAKKDEVYHQISRRWIRTASVLFAIGAVSGTIISFELGFLAKAFPSGLGVLKNIAFRLLEAWRNLRLEDQAFLALRFFPANTS